MGFFLTILLKFINQVSDAVFADDNVYFVDNNNPLSPTCIICGVNSNTTCPPYYVSLFLIALCDAIRVHDSLRILCQLECYLVLHFDCPHYWYISFFNLSWNVCWYFDFYRVCGQTASTPLGSLCIRRWTSQILITLTRTIPTLLTSNWA